MAQMMVFRTLANAVWAALTTVALSVVVISCHWAFTRCAAGDAFLYWFLALFTWRYLRFLINLVAFWCYSPSPKPRNPTYRSSRDITAVIPTVAPDSEGFRETLKSCADNSPAKIIVVVAGDELHEKAASYIFGGFAELHPLVEFVVLRTQVASKRAQVALAVSQIKTPITVLLDDHVFWGPRYLETLLYPFENAAVGFVGTNKRVLRKEGLNLWGRLWNMLGATYLCRHNFEIRATNTVDGGVFVVSGRTCAIRTEILQHPKFLPNYTNEKFFFGMFGPLNPDDDNYITRFVVRYGWKIKIQYTEDTVLETTVGVERPLAGKFLGQCRRWARTTWRSNICSLVTDRTVWASQPYCVYAVYLTSLTNFAAITDPLLVYLFTHSSLYTARYTLACLVCWILFTKTVKVFDYFRRHPRDIILFPAYVAFAYFHSFIKLWALLTFWDCAWSGRRLDLIKVNNSNPTPNPPSPDHPHLTALRAIHARINALHTQQTQHIESYQLPLLAELQQLRESFATLHEYHSAMSHHQEAIRAELRQVVALAEEASAAQMVDASTGKADMAAAISEVKAAVAGMEERWRVGVEGVVVVESREPGAAKAQGAASTASLRRGNGAAVSV